LTRPASTGLSSQQRACAHVDADAVSKGRKLRLEGEKRGKRKARKGGEGECSVAVPSPKSDPGCATGEWRHLKATST